MNRLIRSRTYLILACIILFLSGTLCLGQVTPPEEFLGFKPGADFHLANYEQAIGCWSWTWDPHQRGEE
jgi:hypothetical protein